MVVKKCFVIAFLVFLFLSGCAEVPLVLDGVDEQYPDTVSSASSEIPESPAIADSTTSDIPERYEDEPEDLLPIEDDDYIPNPYPYVYYDDDDYDLAYWRYDLFEVFRGAEKMAAFDDTLDYLKKYETLILREEEDGGDVLVEFTCSIILPQATGSEPWAERINAFYQDILPGYIAYGDAIGNNIGDGWWYLDKLGYYYEGAYQLDNVITAVHSCANFTFERRTIAWNPITDVFSALDGRKLDLGDLFGVSRDEYLPVLQASLLNATKCFSIEYDPARDEEFRITHELHQRWIIEYLEEVDLAIAPVGLVFIFPVGYVGAMVEGIIFLHVPYEDLEGLLNPLYFSIHDT